MTLLRPPISLKPNGIRVQALYRRNHALAIRSRGNDQLVAQASWHLLRCVRADRRDQQGRLGPCHRKEKMGTARRIKRKDDRVLPGKKRLGFRGKGDAFLTVKNFGARRDTALLQTGRQIPRRDLAAQMKAGAAHLIGDHPGAKRLDITACIICLETMRPGGLAGCVPNRITWQITARAKAGEGVNPVDRGKDQCGHIAQIKRNIQKFDPHHGRDHDTRPTAPQATQMIGQPACRCFWPCDQDGEGHFCSTVVCVPFRCYLPENNHATGALMTYPLTVLGLESSCDDTAAAVLRVSQSTEILSSVVYGQDTLHQSFGGVVPEIAARAHAEKLDLCVAEALRRAQTRLSSLDLIAVTSGPGLIGGVISGMMCAKGIAAGAGLPLVGVNHLAGHALTPRMTDGLHYPYLVLLVSGGHCQFLIARSCEDFSRLGGTIDDAPGEAFDKVARLLGLGQPGGPAVEAAARHGDPARFGLPRPLLDRVGCDMSFSGLKTAVLRARDDLVSRQGGLTKADRADLCAGFQAAICDVLVEKTRRALSVYLKEGPEVPALAVAGGVAANSVIRTALQSLCAQFDIRFTAPPTALCTDNAAMIAHAGAELFRAGHRDDMTLAARPRWPLDQTSPAMLGSGRKGAKA